MKITKSQLKQIIKEELDSTLLEQEEPNWGEVVTKRVVKSFFVVDQQLTNLRGALRSAVKLTNSGNIKADAAAAQKALDAVEKMQEALEAQMHINNAWINSIKK